MIQSNPLLLMVGLPIVIGILCLPLSDRLKSVAKVLSFLVTLASLAGSIFIFIKRPMNWQCGVTTMFNADNLSSFIGLGISFFAFLITIYSFGFVEKSLGRYFGYILITLGVSLGVAFANDLIALIVFWGILAITLYLLVNMQATESSSRAAKKALIIIGSSDAIMIFGIALIWMITRTFSMDRVRLPLTDITSLAAYICIAVAAFAKAGAMPFHSWLPDVAQDGPTPVTAYLPASLDKLLGIYLLARASLNLFIMNSTSNMVLLVVGSVTIIFAVMMALVQHDFKRLLGYHAVSQVGYMVLGIGTGSPVGIAGGLFHMLNNAIYKSCLFLTGGAVEKRAGTTDLTKLGGLAKNMPITFISCLIASLAISGVPPFNGFVSKWMVYQGIIELGKTGARLWIVWLACAMFGSALTLASFLKLLHTTFLGQRSKDLIDIREAGFAFAFPMVTLAGICCIFGIFAFAIPLSIFIIPSIGQAISYLGVWVPTTATALLMISILSGLLIYPFYRPKMFRSVQTFVGGEDPESLQRVSGVEFYDTIKDMKGLKFIYEKEEAKSFDIYDQGKNIISFFTKILQHLHNGVLPTYIVWCLLGMIGMFFILFFR